jgi:hypothetical protein
MWRAFGAPATTSVRTLRQRPDRFSLLKSDHSSREDALSNVEIPELRTWIGKTLAEVITDWYRIMFDRHLQQFLPEAMDDEELRNEHMAFWETYNAETVVAGTRRDMMWTGCWKRRVLDFWHPYYWVVQVCKPVAKCPSKNLLSRWNRM